MKAKLREKLDLVLDILSRKNLTINTNRLKDTLSKTLLTNSDVLCLFDVTSRTTRRWRKNGRIPYLRITNRLYYLPDDVMNLLLFKYRNLD